MNGLIKDECFILYPTKEEVRKAFKALWERKKTWWVSLGDCIKYVLIEIPIKEEVVESVGLTPEQFKWFGANDKIPTVQLPDIPGLVRLMDLLRMTVAQLCLLVMSEETIFSEMELPDIISESEDYLRKSPHRCSFSSDEVRSFLSKLKQEIEARGLKELLE